MEIQAVSSYLGAWELLQKHFTTQFKDIQESLLNIHTPMLTLENPSSEKERVEYWFGQLSQRFRDALREQGWVYKKLERGTHLKKLEHQKGTVGAVLFLKKTPLILQSLVTNYPVFFRTGEIEVMMFMVPMRNLVGNTGGRIASYERIRDLLIDVTPDVLNFPFAIVGFDAHQNESLEITKLSTPLNDYLIKTLGMSFDEVVLMGECPEYDFKLMLPDNKKIAQEVCGMANQKGGGILFIGITDDGYLEGIESTKLDEIQLQLTNIIRMNCEPVPRFSFHVFPAESSTERVILVVRIEELTQKPCMTYDRVYIRSGPSVRVAKPHEIRNLIQGI